MPILRARRWTTEEGLPQNRIACLTQTRDGYLWLGTWDGLARFDGVRFTVFNESNTPELESGAINALAVDSQGTLWIGTRAGLVGYRGRKFAAVALPGEMARAPVWRLAAAPGGGVWVQAHELVTKLDHGRFSRQYRMNSSALPQIRSLQAREDGALNVFTALGWFTVSPSGDSVQTNFMQAASEPWLLSGLEGEPGRAWLGTAVAGIKLVSQAGGEPVFPVTPCQGMVDFMFRDRAANIWMDILSRTLVTPTPPTAPRLYCWDGAQCNAVSLGDGVDDAATLCMIEDLEGNYWVGTEQGLVQLRRQPVRTYTVHDGLSNNDTWSVCEDKTGAVWVTSNQAGLNRIATGSVEQVSKPALSLTSESAGGTMAEGAGQAEQPRVWKPATQQTGKSALQQIEDFSPRIGEWDWPNLSIWPAPQGVWLTKNRRLLEVRGEEVIRRRNDLPLLGALYEDHQGWLWGGTSTGAVSFNVRNVSPDGKIECRPAILEGCSIKAIFQDRTGTLWFGTQGKGLARVEQGVTRFYTERDGLAGSNVWTICQDKDGGLWFGGDRGLTRWKENRFFAFTRNQGLAENTVNCALEDDDGCLWLSGQQGIHRLRLAELNAVAEGRAQRVESFTLGTADGMESAESNGEKQPSGWKAHDGRLWFPTGHGLVVFDPKAIRDAPPPVVIEEVRADDRVLVGDFEVRVGQASSLSAATDNASSPAAQGPRSGKMPVLHQAALCAIAPGRGRVMEFRYTANTFVAPEHARFRYRLIGADADWHDGGNQRSAQYLDLQPGNYRFEVMAADAHNVWNSEPASFALYLAPFVWQTWPFYVGSASLVFFTAFGIHHQRVKGVSRIQRLEQQRALEEERVRIAKDLHDDLGANLTGVAFQLELVREQQADTARIREQLAGIAERTRGLVDNMREVVWAMNPRFDNVEGLAGFLGQYAEKLLAEAGLRCRLDLPLQGPPCALNSTARHQLFLAVKEALQNVLRHAHASEVRLCLEQEDRQLRLVVADNGRGLSGKPRPAGHGLDNIEERIRALGGRFVINSHPNQGTELQITIPL